MNVNVLQNNNPYFSKFDVINRNRLKPEVSSDVKSSISSNEVQYFKKLFPENSSQIDNYISFNHRGKITTINNSKGSLIDNII
jgi:hypothetical protein